MGEEKKQEKEKQPEVQGKEVAYEQLEDKFLRLGAEFENYKKRARKEREDLIKYSSEVFILELLQIVDNFERAFQAADQTQDFKALHQGVEMILKQVQEFLKEKGVKKIEAVGQPFDPHKHEAMEFAVCEDKPADTVVEELQPGYELNGKIIRPARVKVSKKSLAAE
ncbi:MAG: nucleotide exchange factor GrpE [Candidatus Omnitrophica bacterium]|nr:nucleotide exchange factor GrpE [Candidatus Omnitrophota bacterium]